ncbi:hypothetical protein AX774_g6363 [Zancudomyces culisetae]|uniref:Uncharacterized protein n=1 Tax=Zancudomyces culisetae TaxID=1213189 RepID=A0A1R1PGS9_ZANCU|nr:hypothetical protein AX774_g6363 [Zancudomyces culisetae]|eukprot:OMH80205.1 hypothetical protein AX774_g6363 [Zancudomyces culisetae]
MDFKQIGVVRFFSASKSWKTITVVYLNLILSSFIARTFSKILCSDASTSCLKSTTKILHVKASGSLLPTTTCASDLITDILPMPRSPTNQIAFLIFKKNMFIIFSTNFLLPKTSGLGFCISTLTKSVSLRTSRCGLVGFSTEVPFECVMMLS